jgi:predicted kinase
MRGSYDPWVTPTPVVIVCGPPASGKTVLARRLAFDLSLPLVTKDGLKETLYEAVGVGDIEWSQRLGRGAIALVWHVLEAELAAGRSVLVEGNFDAVLGSRTLEGLAERFPLAALQIHCRAEADVLRARYLDRAGTRHPGHMEEARLDALEELLDADRYRLAVPGEFLTYETTTPLEEDYIAVRDAVAAHLGVAL